MADRPDLAEFLRARRERLTPRQVGLPDSGRRRTPGLRREEVAALAGVSIDYLVRLEQGRDTNPSSSVLVALADALLLSQDERHHMMLLAKVSTDAELCPASSPPTDHVAPTIRLLLDRLGPTPAFVLGPIEDLVAWNDSWERLVGPIGLLDDGLGSNLARFTFLHPRARAVFPDWASLADEQAARLRAVSLHLADQPAFSQLIEDLSGVPAFAERWSAHTVAERRGRLQRVVHPGVGELRVASEVMALAEANGQRLVVWLPQDAATDEAIRRATIGETGLRAV